MGRAFLLVPLLREDEASERSRRRRVPPFNGQADRELVETFADQAAIAIDNVRLFDEVQARTRELSESLQQQTATADVLKVISRSTFDLKTALQTLVESAARLCDADKATITRQQDGVFYRAEASVSPRIPRIRQGRADRAPERGSAHGRCFSTARSSIFPMSRQIRTIRSLRPEARRLSHHPRRTHAARSRAGRRFVLTRDEARPFTDKQVELVSTFADQAAIAIENVRLSKPPRRERASLRPLWRTCGPRRTG